MFKNAIEKINKFYDLDLNKNSHADEMFDVLNEIIPFDSAAVFYLTPNSLSLEFGKNFEDRHDVKLPAKISEKLYDSDVEHISDDVKQLFNIESDTMASRLVVKGAIVGILIITRDNGIFQPDEKLIFKTCTKIIANLIKDFELSKVLQLQVKAMEEGLIETKEAYDNIKKQNKKIKNNEKLQNQFIANVSHDLRTPLNSIIGFSEALGNKIFGELNEKQQEYIEDIRVSGIRLLGMINEILDITKLESHTIKLNITNIKCEILITEVCNILKPLLEKKGLKVVTNIGPQLELNGDYIKLQQVLFNIIGNAIKFSPNNSVIEINANQTSDKISISIKDYGIGIDKKHQKKIFNKFYQVEDSLLKTEASTGLGLTIAKKFIELHSGKISIISEPDKGTEFIINLPKNQLQ